MSLVGLYAMTAVVVIAVVNAAADLARDPWADPPRHIGVIAVVAGLAWPLLVLGLAEGALIAALGHGALPNREFPPPASSR